MSKYLEKATEIAKLVEKKQEAYGDSFGKSGKILEILYPNGVPVEQYTDMLAIIRIIDKLFRIANQKNAFGEDPYNDILGYSLLGSIKSKSVKVVDEKQDKPIVPQWDKILGKEKKQGNMKDFNEWIDNFSVTDVDKEWNKILGKKAKRIKRNK